jgi:hypothetical protein
MSNSGSHSPAKSGRMDTLLKALTCLSKILQIVQTGFILFKHLG